MFVSKVKIDAYYSAVHYVIEMFSDIVSQPQAGTDSPDCLERVNALLTHPDFSLKNPNKSRALIGAFAANMRRFHAADGAGYLWLADRILQVV